jgi:hypothetical protein
VRTSLTLFLWKDVKEQGEKGEKKDEWKEENER